METVYVKRANMYTISGSILDKSNGAIFSIRNFDNRKNIICAFYCMTMHVARMCFYRYVSTYLSNLLKLHSSDVSISFPEKRIT